MRHSNKNLNKSRIRGLHQTGFGACTISFFLKEKRVFGARLDWFWCCAERLSVASQHKLECGGVFVVVF